jgi:hypothetical protein
MNTLYKWLYKISPRRYEDVLIDAYVESIPEVVHQPVVKVLSDNHVKLKKLTDFLAYQLHRKMSSDPKHSERYQGMFVQIKLFSALIERDATPQRKEEEDRPQAKQAKWYDEALDGVKAFLKKD